MISTNQINLIIIFQYSELFSVLNHYSHQFLLSQNHMVWMDVCISSDDDWVVGAVLELLSWIVSLDFDVAVGATIFIPSSINSRHHMLLCFYRNLPVHETLVVSHFHFVSLVLLGLHKLTTEVVHQLSWLLQIEAFSNRVMFQLTSGSSIFLLVLLKVRGLIELIVDFKHA